MSLDWFLLLQVGLGQVLELAGELLQYLQTFLVALVYRAEGVRELSVQQIRGRALTLVELRPVRQVLELPLQVQRLLRDLQELSKILLQLLVNSTPLYNMVSETLCCLQWTSTLGTLLFERKPSTSHLFWTLWLEVEPFRLR